MYLDYVDGMKTEMNIAEAKAKLSSLVQKALNGEEVVIARDGVPAVRLVPVEAKPKRRFGILREMGYTFDAPFEFFLPDPADAKDSPLFPGDPDKAGNDAEAKSGA
jgi:prevent-host-death family protein